MYLSSDCNRMSWIQFQDDPEMDHIMSIHSLHPAGLAGHLALYEAVMRGTKTLRKVDRELIALVVSSKNSCHY